MDNNEHLQGLQKAVKNAEEIYGTDSAELALALEDYAESLRAEQRLLDAVNVKARADIIRSKRQLPEKSRSVTPQTPKSSAASQAQTGSTKPARETPSATPAKVLVRKYVGNESDAVSKFQSDAAMVANYNYYPTSQVWAPGTYGCGMFLLALLLCWILVGILIFIYMLLVKPPGTLTVTYELREPPVPVEPPANEKTCPRCAEQVKAAAKICRFCGHTFDNEVD